MKNSNNQRTMKITKTVIKQFESEQKDFSTEVAIHNLVWKLAEELLRDIGITKISTSSKKNN